jgi:hypothetical protein
MDTGELQCAYISLPQIALESIAGLKNKDTARGPKRDYTEHYFIIYQYIGKYSLTLFFRTLKRSGRHAIF